jgi:hypothetical protein
VALTALADLVAAPDTVLWRRVPPPSLHWSQRNAAVRANEGAFYRREDDGACSVVIGSFYLERGVGPQHVLKHHDGPWAVLGVTVEAMTGHGCQWDHPIDLVEEDDEPAHALVWEITSTCSKRLVKKSAEHLIVPTREELDRFNQP